MLIHSDYLHYLRSSSDAYGFDHARAGPSRLLWTRLDKKLIFLAQVGHLIGETLPVHIIFSAPVSNPMRAAWGPSGSAVTPDAPNLRRGPAGR